MTRNEALAKLPNGRWYGEEAQKGYLLDCLQVLGLIKFDEEKQIKSIRSVIVDHLNCKYTEADKIVDAIYQAGWKFTR